MKVFMFCKVCKAMVYAMLIWWKQFPQPGKAQYRYQCPNCGTRQTHTFKPNPHKPQ